MKKFNSSALRKFLFMEVEMREDTSIVKRIDLELRKLVMGLKTELYYLGKNKFGIYPLNKRDEMELIKRSLEKVRIVTVWVEILEIFPADDFEKIDSILDENIVSNFEGLVFNHNDTWIFFNSKFPKINFHRIDYQFSPEYKIIFEVYDDASKEEIHKLIKFSEKAKLFTKNISVFKIPFNLKKVIKSEFNDILINSFKMNSSSKKIEIKIIDDIYDLKEIYDFLEKKYTEYKFLLIPQKLEIKDLEHIINYNFEGVEIKIEEINRNMCRVASFKELPKEDEMLIMNFVKEKFPEKYFLVNKNSGAFNKMPLVTKAMLNKDFEYSIREAEFWFNNAGKIYSGEFQKKDFGFFDPLKSKCYFDGSSFQNIDIRNLILLYDEIYLGFPIEDRLNDFLYNQNMSKDQFVELVERGKIKLMLPNFEERYDKDTIRYLESVAPNSILGKRMINSILATEFVEIENKYFLKEVEDFKVLYKLIEIFKNTELGNSMLSEEILLWPLKIKNESFKLFNVNGPMSLDAIGVNKVFEKKIKMIEKKNELSFEFMVNSPNIHIAHALDATYFPFFSKNSNYSDKGVSNILGKFLNMYKYSRGDYEKALWDISNVHKERNSVDLLNCRSEIDVIKFLELNEKYKSTSHLKNLLLNLESMNEVERRQKIKNINELLLELLEAKNGAMIDYALIGSSFIPQLSMGATVLSAFRCIWSNFNIGEKKKIEKLFEKYYNEKLRGEDVNGIHTLAKINRMASLSFGK